MQPLATFDDSDKKSEFFSKQNKSSSSTIKTIMKQRKLKLKPLPLASMQSPTITTATPLLSSHLFFSNKQFNRSNCSNTRVNISKKSSSTSDETLVSEEESAKEHDTANMNTTTTAALLVSNKNIYKTTITENKANSAATYSVYNNVSNNVENQLQQAPKLNSINISKSFKVKTIATTAINTTITNTKPLHYDLSTSSCLASSAVAAACIGGVSGHLIKKVNFILPGTRLTDEDEGDEEEEEDNEGNDDNIDDIAKLANLNKKSIKQHFPIKLPATGHFGRTRKNIVYNGTYPIDMPLAMEKFGHLTTHRYNTEGSITDDPTTYNILMRDFIDAFAGEYGKEERGNVTNELSADLDILGKTKLSPSCPSSPSPSTSHCKRAHQHYQSPHRPATPQVWSMQELIANPHVPLNYKKMCHEVEQSLQQFEDYIDTKAIEDNSNVPVLRTFDVDRPILGGSKMINDRKKLKTL